MAFTAEDILGEFVEASRHAPYVCSASSFTDMMEQLVRGERARRRKAYHVMHARPEWRKARAAKMRAYRAELRAG